MQIISTEEWGASAPRKESNISLPSPALYLHHTVGKYRGKAGMRRLQSDHKARGFRTVGYSFVIDTDDPTYPVYEGAGAGKLGAHTGGHNSRSHGIAITGNFENKIMPPALKARIAELVKHGHKQGWWPNQFTGGHRDTKATACPGQNAYDAISDINRLTLEADLKVVTAMAEAIDYAPYVEELYQDLLGRPSDPEGLEYWVGVLEEGTDKEIVKHEFLVVRLAADKAAMDRVLQKIESNNANKAVVTAEQAYRLFLENLMALGKAE